MLRDFNLSGFLTLFVVVGYFSTWFLCACFRYLALISCLLWIFRTWLFYVAMDD